MTASSITKLICAYSNVLNITAIKVEMDDQENDLLIQNQISKYKEIIVKCLIKDQPFRKKHFANEVCGRRMFR